MSYQRPTNYIRKRLHLALERLGSWEAVAAQIESKRRTDGMAPHHLSLVARGMTKISQPTKDRIEEGLTRMLKDGKQAPPRQVHKVTIVPPKPPGQQLMTMLINGHSVTATAEVLATLLRAK